MKVKIIDLKKILSLKQVTNVEKLIIIGWSLHANSFTPTTARLAEELDMYRTNVHRAIQSLINKGIFIEVGKKFIHKNKKPTLQLKINPELLTISKTPDIGCIPILENEHYKLFADELA